MIVVNNGDGSSSTQCFHFIISSELEF